MTANLPANQVISDFAFLSFGGGPRKCVGDQFALREPTVILDFYITGEFMEWLVNIFLDRNARSFMIHTLFLNSYILLIIITL
ncbi:hypothetical protein P8452_03348 [Trifolium repens]|nr:hypothetical protein P8452_03348 [Trifolium repens]